MVERRAPTFKADLHAKIPPGLKTQTRRLMKPQPHKTVGFAPGFGNRWMYRGHIHEPYHATTEQCFRPWIPLAPYGEPGDVLALREGLELGECTFAIMHKDRTPVVDRRNPNASTAWPWKRDKLTSMYMPLWAARDFVTLKRVWVERLQDISEHDARAEGIVRDWQFGLKAREPVKYAVVRGGPRFDTAILAFRDLWDSINAKPKPVRIKSVHGGTVINHYISHPWEDVQETREYRGKPWIVCGNPWNFCFEFGDYVRAPGRAMQGAD